MDSGKLALIGIALVFIGFFVVFAGVATSIGGGASSASTGGFILIGPIPIVFGNGPNSSSLALVGMAITVLVVVAYLLTFLRWRSRRA
jgi:uncharacterized protein (TIGR00304 family)